MTSRNKTIVAATILIILASYIKFFLYQQATLIVDINGPRSIHECFFPDNCPNGIFPSDQKKVDFFKNEIVIKNANNILIFYKNDILLKRISIKHISHRKFSVSYYDKNKDIAVLILNALTDSTIKLEKRLYKDAIEIQMKELSKNLIQQKLTINRLNSSSSNIKQLLDAKELYNGLLQRIKETKISTRGSTYKIHKIYDIKTQNKLIYDSKSILDL